MDTKQTALSPLSVERANDIMTNAVETGIAYWMNEDCTNVKLVRNSSWGSEDISSWAYLSVSFTCEGKNYVVTPEAMQAKAQAFGLKYPWHLENILEESDDAETADAFFQFTAFDEIVYG